MRLAAARTPQIPSSPLPNPLHRSLLSSGNSRGVCLLFIRASGVQSISGLCLTLWSLDSLLITVHYFKIAFLERDVRISMTKQESKRHIFICQVNISQWLSFWFLFLSNVMNLSLLVYWEWKLIVVNCEEKRVEDADAIRMAEVSWAAKEKLLSLQDQLKYLGGCAKAGGPRIRNAVVKAK